jgi:hypothetical protein
MLQHRSRAPGRFEDIDRVVAYMPSGSTQGRPAADYAYGRALFMSRDAGPVGAPSGARGLSPHLDRERGQRPGPVPRRRHPRAARALPRGRARAFRRVLDDGGRPGRARSTWRTCPSAACSRSSAAPDEAVAAYETVEPSSPYFSQMLYELAWTHVSVARTATTTESERAAYARALQATELSHGHGPGAHPVPRGPHSARKPADPARRARDRIPDLREHHRPLRAALVASSSEFQGPPGTTPETFFEQLVASELDVGDVPTTLPEIALDYAREQDGLHRVVRVERDLSTSENEPRGQQASSCSSSPSALSGEQRYRMFAGLRGPRDRMISIRGRALASDLELLECERSLVASPR